MPKPLPAFREYQPVHEPHRFRWTETENLCGKPGEPLFELTAGVGNGSTIFPLASLTETGPCDQIGKSPAVPSGLMTTNSPFV